MGLNEAKLAESRRCRAHHAARAARARGAGNPGGWGALLDQLDSEVRMRILGAALGARARCT